MEKNLSQLQANEISKVKYFICEDKLKQRLIDMGITPGVVIKIIKRSPFGDPIHIRLRGCDFLIREQLAKNIYVE